MRLIAIVAVAVLAVACNYTTKEIYNENVVVNPIPTQVIEGEYETPTATVWELPGGLKIVIPSGGIADAMVLVQTNNDGTDQKATVDADATATVTPGGGL